MSHPPTLEQRRALAAYLEAQREAIHRAERNARIERAILRVDPATLEPTTWQLIKGEFRASPMGQKIGFFAFAGSCVGVSIAAFAGWLA